MARKKLNDFEVYGGEIQEEPIESIIEENSSSSSEELTTTPLENKVKTSFAKKPVPKKVKVIVHSQIHPELNEVFVGLNGKGYLIKLGVPVEIPYELYEVLRNAKIKQVKQFGAPTEYEIQRFNVELLEWF